MFRVQQIDHVEVYVLDQYAAAAWYEQVFGTHIVPEFEDWAADGPLMIGTHEADTKIALFKGVPPNAHGKFSAKRVAFRVDGEGFLTFLDRLATITIMNDDGEPLTRDQVVDHDKSWSIYFMDPDGNRYEITTYDYTFVKDRL